MKILKNLIVLSFSFSIAFAQGNGSIGIGDPRSAGMGNTFMASSRGVYAIGKNPANLAIPESNAFELSTFFPMPNMNLRLGNDFFTLDDYKKYFTGVLDSTGNRVGRYLEGSEKNKFLDLFDAGTAIRTNVSFNLFAITYYPSAAIGAFGFSINDKLSVRAAFPKDLLDLAFEGNTVGKTFTFDDMDARAWYLRDYTLSYARDLTPLLPKFFERVTAGVSLKIVHGYFYVGLDKINTAMTTLDNSNISVSGNMKMNVAASPDFGIVYDFEDTTKAQNIGPFPSPAGSGVGFDLGVSAKLNDIWSFGFAITDIGSISWDEGTVEYTSSGDEFVINDPTNSELIDSLAESFKGEGQYTKGFNSGLPTALRLGSSAQVDKYFDSFYGTLLVVVDYNQGFNDLPSNSTTPRFSIGTEYRPWAWFPLRTGFSFGGLHGFNWGFGFGFDAGLFEFNLATSDFQSLVAGNSAKRVGISMGTRWRF
ncbi:MAG: hypothetical protein KKD86_10960 [Bacteroidetes bacterium]|nr:hypothetical protein [Bacteroidota bacterium]